MLPTFATLLLTLSPGPVQADLRPQDRICLVGNALAERMQHHGWLEARLHARLPEHELSFRNLGFSADEVTIHQRTSGFGGIWDEWLGRTEADVVFAFFGFNESFAGMDGAADFERELAALVAQWKAQSFGSEPARVVLFSPIPIEELDGPGRPDARARNEAIELYGRIIGSVAAVQDAAFVDLFRPMRARYAAADRPLTIDGIHLNERGNAALAEVVEAALLGAVEAEPAEVERLRPLVLAKNDLWFDRYRATDGYNVYGGRSGLKYAAGISNFDVLQREMEILDALTAGADRRIWRAAGAGEGRAPVEVPAPIRVATNRPGEGPGGAHLYLDGEEAIGRMTVAEGMRVELFADELRFLELVNPVQMAFDPRGRLWVAVWPTYPHAEPGVAPDDKLLIFEDTDGDGRADVRKVFAGDLHNPTGFEFWNGGVMVACAPDLLFLKDTDGDDVADVSERVLHGLSSADTHHSANSFVHGPDGALYFQEGTFHMSQVETVHGPVRNRNGCVWRFEPRTWRVERYVAYNFANPHGHVFDHWGQDFVTDGTGNVNYWALPFSGHLEPPAKHGGYFPFFQQRSRPCAATEILSSSHFPESHRGNYLVANVIGFQGIFQYAFEDDGSGFGATELEPIVFSSDPNFRPSDIEVGPDGAIWFLDWHNALIGHMQHHLRDPSRDRAHGRVYRVTWDGRELLSPAPIAGAPIEALVERLASPDDRERYRARIELSARPSADVVAAARSWARELDPGDPDREHHLLEALWLQQQHAALDGELLDRLLDADDARARAAAVRVVRHMRREVADPLGKLRAAVLDEHPRVRLEAVVGLGFLGGPEAAEAALAALRSPMDRFLDYALNETWKTLGPHALEALRAGEDFAADDPVGLAYALERLDSESLARVRPSEPSCREVLRRSGLDVAHYLRAADWLAAAHGTTPAGELLEAIERADERTDGRADERLAGLFAALDEIPVLAAGPRASLRALEVRGRRAATRRRAVVAGMLAEGTTEGAWSRARATAGGTVELLDAFRFLRDTPLAEEAWGRARAALEPSEVREASDAAPGTPGRWVRIELPGEERTLTLAEVEVVSGGRNVASEGTATQSTINWGGEAQRAVDGVTSALWTDGGQTHTLEDRPNPWWELDLGAVRPIEEIVVWNRADGWGHRLEGFTLRVLDAERRTVFERAGEPAPDSRATFHLVDPWLRARRGAVRAMASLGVREAETVRELGRRLDDPELGRAATRALASIPAERWPADVTAALTAELPRRLEAAREDHDLLALADTLLASLGAGEAAELRRLRAGLGPLALTIRPLPDSLLFDRSEITVAAGRAIELRFENVDIMPHNLIVTAPGALAKVGTAAEAMAAKPDAWSKGFVPDLPEVLVASRLLQPGEEELLAFDAPTEPGDYPFVCTFPGHWVRMNGVLRVVPESEADPLANALVSSAGGTDAPDAAAAPARSFVRNWTLDELRPHLAGVDGRSPEAGRAVLEAASCLRCHSIGAGGPTTGPELGATVAKYAREELLAHILDPSAKVDPEWATEIVVTTDGHVVAGRIVAEDATTLLVQDDPYQDRAPTEVSLADVESRRRSNVSAMPSGLMTTFEREEILDLLAYLGALAESD